MASLQSVSAAIESSRLEKSNLRKAFDDLHSHSSALAYFTLKWKDLEDHFDAIEKSIEKRLSDLKSVEVRMQPDETSPTEPKPSDQATLVWPEMKSICKRMDGKELRSFILAHRKEGADVRTELDLALQSAPDPAKMVLDAMGGFYSLRSKGEKDVELASIRRVCILLLERLTSIGPVITESMREKAKSLALEWKGRVGVGGDSQLEGLAFLQLLAAYGVCSAISSDEVLDVIVVVSRRKQATDLVKALGFVDKIPDLIQKFINKGKQLDAVNFAYAFNVVEKFPPVPLLKAYIKEVKKVAQEVRKKGNNSTQSLNEATAKEIAACRAVIKSIGEHELQSDYSVDELEKRIAQLEKQKADMKRSVAVAAKSHQQHLNKKPRQGAIAPNAGPQVLPQPLPAGLLTNAVNSFAGNAGLYAPVGVGVGAPASGSASGSGSFYGIAGGSGAVPVSSSSYPLTGGPGSSGPFAMAGDPGAASDAFYGRGSRLPGQLAYGGNLSPHRPHISAEAFSSSLYDKPTGYGGYSAPRGVPPYDSSYFSRF